MFKHIIVWLLSLLGYKAVARGVDAGLSAYEEEQTGAHIQEVSRGVQKKIEQAHAAVDAAADANAAVDQQLRNLGLVDEGGDGSSSATPGGKGEGQ